MRIVERTITVAWQVDGYHRWPDATPARDYLASRHRHRFDLGVQVPVTHDERDIEFHDLLDVARQVLEGYREAGRQTYDFGDLSCEAIASELALSICHRYDVSVVAFCSEDGYVTAEVRAVPKGQQQ